ncbi:MAG: hypothetical protein HY507_00125 [Candidatus Zambryskibacteria bacterium]|nr:hypothetical protein [Candidatus Zambryskibacteria bacterium]
MSDLSDQGLRQVAEAEHEKVLAPHPLEAAEAEVEVTVVVRTETRNTVVALEERETIFLVERAVSFSFWQQLAFLLENERGALRSRVNGILTIEKTYSAKIFLYYII